MILGVGDGTFAILFVSVAAIVLAIIFAYLLPKLALATTLVCLSLPFIVFGIIASAPRKSSSAVSVRASLYDDLPFDSSDVNDTLLPVRVVLLVVLCLGLLTAFAVYVYDVLNAPLFTAPTVQCRRKQLEALHPSWYK